MASLTINDLKNELINHGIELPPSSSKKEDYVQLYEKNIPGGEKTKIDFSSDDDEVTFPVEGKVSKKRVSRKSEGINGHADENGETLKQGKLTEENSLVVGEINVATLTDEQLASKLKEFNISVGPIVDSTRAVYRKKLAITMRELMNEKANVTIEANGIKQTNGITHDTIDGELQNGEYSADDEELLDKAPPKENSEDEQPSLQVRPSVTPTPPGKETKNSVSNRSASRTSSIAKAKAAISDVRQRFTGSTNEANVTDGRYTPTPRRSIHSYKVTETTRETVTKNKDGTTSRDFDCKKMTSTSQDEIGGARKVLKFLPSLFLLLIVVAVGYYVYVSRK